MRRVAIIGAGLAGVAAARELARRGNEVVIFEKSRGMGGRCASKRWEGHVIDHGAQYFTIRDERFRAAVAAASQDRVVPLTAPVLPDAGRDEERWFHRDGNSRLVRDLADGLDVRLGTTIDDPRTLRDAFDHVVSTAPWPQTARLFGLDDAGCGYVPCLAAILAYRGEWLGRTAEAYAWRATDPAAPLAWTACENHKPGRIAPGFTVLVAHLSEAFSREHLERPAEAYPALIRASVEEAWGLPAEAWAAGLGHRWRLARVEEALEVPELPPGLHFVGDAIRASRVEDAWLAGFGFAASFA